jgi:hypothetical protein
VYPEDERLANSSATVSVQYSSITPKTMHRLRGGLRKKRCVYSSSTRGLYTATFTQKRMFE